MQVISAIAQHPICYDVIKMFSFLLFIFSQILPSGLLSPQQTRPHLLLPPRHPLLQRLSPSTLRRPRRTRGPSPPRRWPPMHFQGRGWSSARVQGRPRQHQQGHGQSLDQLCQVPWGNLDHSTAPSSTHPPSPFLAKTPDPGLAGESLSSSPSLAWSQTSKTRHTEASWTGGDLIPLLTWPPPCTRLKLWDALYWQDKKRQLTQLASRSVWHTLYPFFVWNVTRLKLEGQPWCCDTRFL